MQSYYSGSTNAEVVAYYLSTNSTRSIYSTTSTDFTGSTYSICCHIGTVPWNVLIKYNPDKRMIYD